MTNPLGRQGKVRSFDAVTTLFLPSALLALPDTSTFIARASVMSSHSYRQRCICHVQANVLFLNSTLCSSHTSRCTLGRPSDFYTSNQASLLYNVPVHISRLLIGRWSFVLFSRVCRSNETVNLNLRSVGRSSLSTLLFSPDSIFLTCCAKISAQN